MTTVLPTRVQAARLTRPLVFLIASLLVMALTRLPVASAADSLWIGDDGFGSSDFNRSGNWQGGQVPPDWSYSNSLKFNQNLKSNVTGLNYDFGDWRAVNDIFWDSTFPVSRTLTASNGGGIGFKIRVENQSSFTQTVAMALSGGSNGAPEIQLNPVAGSLIISGTIYNDNSKNYTVYGSQTATVTTLTLNSALGPNATQANVNFNVASGRNTDVQVNASQVWAGTTNVDSGAFTTANGVTLASTAIVVSGGTVATTSANTLADAASLTVNTGRLSIGGSDTVASLAGSGGTVDLAAAATLTFGGSGSNSYAGSITGSGNLTKVGSGTFTLSAASSMTGTTTVSAGQFSLGGSNLLADTSAVAVAGGVLALSGNSDTVGAFTISGGSLTGSGTVTAANYALGGGTVSANLGSGTMNVTGNASLNGTSKGTTLNLTSGTLTLGSAGRLAATTAVAVTGSAGGALTLGGNETIGSLAGAANVAIGSNTLTVGGANTNTSYAGSIIGSGGLTKVGGGNLVLSGSNSFTGATTVSAGRLSVNGSLGNTAVTVQSGGELGGAGSIAGALSVLAGGTLSPGNSIESLIVGATTLSGSSTFEYEYDSSASLSLGADLLRVNGNLSIGSGAIVTFTDLALAPQAFANYTTRFAMIAYTGSWNGGFFTYDGTELTDGSRFFVGSQEWEIDYNRTSADGLANFTGDYPSGSSFVAMTAVPEPSTIALALAGLGGLVARGWQIRRHKQR